MGFLIRSDTFQWDLAVIVWLTWSVGVGVGFSGATHLSFPLVARDEPWIGGVK